ncbi:MAG TPA: RecX family transcriptional regulator [Magnetospirillaceae bacterium]|nr:RecX family transcriptional regulator [Magnetospirillaceae bacterium]
MTITGIKVQVKNPDRVSVYVDGKYALSLSYSQVLDQKIRIGLEVDESHLETLKHASDFGKAYEQALMFVMLRPRSTREVQDYARRKKWTPEDTQAIIEKLIAKQHLDDHTFTRSWVGSRALGKKTSARKLRMELKQKGVTDDIIKEVFATSHYDELDALRELITKKRKLARYGDEQKLIRYLAGQGFGFDDIKNALNH